AQATGTKIPRVVCLNAEIFRGLGLHVCSGSQIYCCQNNNLGRSGKQDKRFKCLRRLTCMHACEEALGKPGMYVAVRFPSAALKKHGKAQPPKPQPNKKAPRLLARTLEKHESALMRSGRHGFRLLRHSMAVHRAKNGQERSGNDVSMDTHPEARR